MVTARSVELGSISDATWIEAPVTSRISLILDPPLPIKDPHCEAGTISLKVIGGLGTVAGDTKLAKSCKKKPITFRSFLTSSNVGNQLYVQSQQLFLKYADDTQAAHVHRCI